MSDAPAEIVALARALELELGEEHHGWHVDKVEPQRFGRWTVLCALRSGRKSLGFLISPKDVAEPAYKRTDRYDVVYFSEDVPDEKQSVIYQRDRETIDRFARFIEDWDRRSGA